MTYILFDKYPPNKIEPLMYEVTMLNGTYKLYSEMDTVGAVNGILRSAILESFLLHARILMDFLEDHEGWGDNLTCSKFTGIDGKPMEGISVKLKDDIRKNLGKHLAHLTQVRADTKAAWNITEMKNELNEGISSFIENCADSNFPDDASQWKLAFAEQTQNKPEPMFLNPNKQS